MLIATLGSQLEPFAGSGRVVPWHRHAMPPEWGKNDAFNGIADVMLAIAMKGEGQIGPLMRITNLVRRPPQPSRVRR